MLTNEQDGEICDMTRGADDNLYGQTSWFPSLSYPPVVWSPDNGQSWQLTGEDGLPIDATLDVLQAVPEHPGRLLMGNWSPGGVWESNDHGFTWHRLLRGLPEIPAGVFCIYRNPYSGHLYIGLRDQGLFRSTDFGDSWHQIQTPTVGIHGRGYFPGLVAGEGGMLHGSQTGSPQIALNDATTFEGIPMSQADLNHSVQAWPIDFPLDTPILRTIELDLLSDELDFFMYHSEDNGASWIVTDAPGRYLPEVTTIQTDSGLVLAALDQSEMLTVSFDLGNSWETRPMPCQSGTTLKGLNGDLYMRQRHEPYHYWRSRDIGLTWENLNFPDEDILNCRYEVIPLALDDTLYVNTWNLTYAMYPQHMGVWEERGYIWEPFDHLGYVDWDIVAAPADTFIAAVSDYEHYLSISHDMGWTWEEQEIEMPPDLHGEIGVDIVYDKWRDRLWIDTGVGLAYMDNPTLAVGEDVWVFQPATYATLSAYPNPFNSATTVRYSLTQPGEVRVTVFDLLGREVAVLHDRMVTAGEHELLFDASDLSSGTYFLNLNSNDQTLTRKLTLVK